MKRSVIFPLLIALPFLILCSCGLKKSEAHKEREAWIESLNDSITFYKMQVDDFTERLDDLHKEIADMLTDFEHVSNPREVTGYYICKDWVKKIPLNKSGIYARLSEDEKLEINATMMGGVFNQIQVSSPSATMESEIVPHDQAFNYRIGNKNMVWFSGNEADTIAEFIKDNLTEKLTLTFLNGEKKSGSIVIPDDEKEMIAQTWRLYESQLEVRMLQRKIRVYSNAVNACRSLIDGATPMDN